MAKIESKAKKKVAKRALPKMPRHRQYGVIPVRVARGGHLQVLLLTSRGTGRWVIPKGWPMSKRTPAGTAEREAFEEAGVKGALLSRRPIGSYRYMKNDEKFTGTILVRVFILAVEEQKKDWPEAHERRTRWFPAHRAATLVRERGLARLLQAIPRFVTGNEALFAAG
jgi:8-oxo-dGTP pyrophosphatase MutT (NUDIX family)